MSYSSGKNPGGVDKKERRVTPIITPCGEGSDPYYLIKKINRDTLRQKSISIRSSKSWIDAYNTPNGGLAVPFIDRLGRFSGHAVYSWSCDPRSLISTVTSTIANRLVSYAKRHNKWFVIKRYLRPMLEAAAYYAFSKNLHFWDRILYFVRNLTKCGKLIHRLRLFFTSKWDDNKRFVYSQVIFQTNWLLFRASRPRDKSHFFKKGGSCRWGNPSEAPSRIDVTNQIRVIAYAMSLL